jgi:hypothetical protein
VRPTRLLLPLRLSTVAVAMFVLQLLIQLLPILAPALCCGWWSLAVTVHAKQIGNDLPTLVAMGISSTASRPACAYAVHHQRGTVSLVSWLLQTCFITPPQWGGTSGNSIFVLCCASVVC